MEARRHHPPGNALRIDLARRNLAYRLSKPVSYQVVFFVVPQYPVASVSVSQEINKSQACRIPVTTFQSISILHRKPRAVVLVVDMRWRHW